MSEEDAEMMAFMAEINSIAPVVCTEIKAEDDVETEVNISPVKIQQKVAAVCVASSKPVYTNIAKVETPTSSSTGKSTAEGAQRLPDNSCSLHAISSASITDSSFKFIPPVPTEPKPVVSTSFQQLDMKTGQPKVYKRKGADGTWEDPTLSEWPENDFRLFVGDLAKETSETDLVNAFKHYKSFAKAKVVHSFSDVKSRGFGFVSFLDPMDCAKALREMNGKYLGNRPMKISKSTWKDRDVTEIKKKDAKKRKIERSLGL